jgi:serine/threonine protein kinase
MLNKEICHRDIKPANVLKIKDDFFLADFGESEALEGIKNN